VRRLDQSARSDRAGRGQGLVEFTLILPVFLVLLMGMLEFGIAFDHDISLSYASREGARVGSALVNGGGPLGCDAGAGESPLADAVDPMVIAAVQRVLTSPGSLVDLDEVVEIRIFRADADGAAVGGDVNVWTYAAGAGPVVDGVALDFVEGPVGYPTCQRRNVYLPGLESPHSIGVAIVYRYDLRTPIGAFLRIFGGSSLAGLSMSDHTVMAMNPTNTDG
jgi:hypothetical protein